MFKQAVEQALFVRLYIAAKNRETLGVMAGHDDFFQGETVLPENLFA
jgi:hypothetical protein